MSDLSASHPSLDPTPLRGVNLYLVGMMGAGKTTLGRHLARCLGYHFFDTDQLIEEVSGATIPALFAERGEPRFRELETQVLAQLAPYRRLVVATGGGLVQKPENWSYLHHGIVIWLKVDPPQLLHRLQADPTPRPLLETADPAATLQRLLTQRLPYYSQADVHISIPNHTSPEDLVSQVWQQVLQRLRSH
jgi:shikimate kinase